MANRISIEVNDDLWAKSIQQATFTIANKVYHNMTKACLVVVNEAKKLCPVDNGPLRASIIHQVKMSGSAIEGYVGATMKYAVYVHQGTGIYAVDGNGRKTPWKYKAETGKYKGWHITQGQKPNPFLANARDNKKDNIVSILGG